MGKMSSGFKNLCIVLGVSCFFGLAMDAVFPVKGLMSAAGPLNPPVSDLAPASQQEGNTEHYAERTRKLAAVIVDDFGNGMKGTKEMLDLPAHITVAVMPFLPTTKQDAEEANRKGHDVLVHLPMEPNKGKKEWLGPGAIMSDMTDEEVRTRVEAAIDDVPHAVGINNHMGSKITADRRIMSVILDVCKERGMFFVDSRTSHKSVVDELATEKGLPPVHNDIFLDDVYTLTHVSRKMNTVSNWLDSHDTCVMIGHVGMPGLYTSSVLRQSIPELQQKTELVGIRRLVSTVWGWTPQPTMPLSAP